MTNMQRAIHNILMGIILLYLEFYAPTFTSVEILRAAELSPSSSVHRSCLLISAAHYIKYYTIGLMHTAIAATEVEVSTQ